MIVRVSKADALALADMGVMMWQEHTTDSLVEEFEELLAEEDCAVFLCRVEGRPVGFAQCQLRYDYVEGTDSSPVGYLEGIFVREEYRKNGYAKELLDRCEEWAREKGCTEFASDCELTNHGSLAFHLKVGFTEANRIICFTKKL